MWRRVLGLVGVAAGFAVGEVDAQHTYPKRSNNDSALLEWGNSAIIHNADAVVARFGPGATHPELELGIEAELVTGSPRQGCEPLVNSKAVRTQIVVLYRGGCDFGTKAKHATRAGAAAMIVVNSDRRSPDRAFAMTLGSKGETAHDGDPEVAAEVASLPSLMVSYASGLQLRDHGPRRMRLFAGGGRPFIESVTDVAPVVYLVHNAITDAEIKAARRTLGPYLTPTAADASVERAHRILGKLKSSDLAMFYERIASIVGYPTEHLSEIALEKRTSNSFISMQLRDDRRFSRFDAERGDDSRLHTIMSIYVYLDDNDDAALHFPRARPAPLKIAPRTGLAVVWYSALEDGSVDPTAVHGDAPPFKGDSIERLHIRVYAKPRPIARRLLLPLLLAPIGGAPSKTIVLAATRFFVRAFGPDPDNAIDLALIILAALIAAPICLVAFIAYKAYERSKTPPKRYKTVLSQKSNNSSKTSKKKHNKDA